MYYNEFVFSCLILLKQVHISQILFLIWIKYILRLTAIEYPGICTMLNTHSKDMMLPKEAPLPPYTSSLENGDRAHNSLNQMGDMGEHDYHKGKNTWYGTNISLMCKLFQNVRRYEAYMARKEEVLFQFGENFLGNVLPLIFWMCFSIQHQPSVYFFFCHFTWNSIQTHVLPFLSHLYTPSSWTNLCMYDCPKICTGTEFQA